MLKRSKQSKSLILAFLTSAYAGNWPVVTSWQAVRGVGVRRRTRGHRVQRDVDRGNIHCRRRPTASDRRRPRGQPSPCDPAGQRSAGHLSRLAPASRRRVRHRRRRPRAEDTSGRCRVPAAVLAHPSGRGPPSIRLRGRLQWQAGSTARLRSDACRRPGRLRPRSTQSTQHLYRLHQT